MPTLGPNGRTDWTGSPDGGLVKGPFRDCECISHHAHGPSGHRGCSLCHPELLVPTADIPLKDPNP
jgi:hypothetical protein